MKRTLRNFFKEFFHPLGMGKRKILIWLTFISISTVATAQQTCRIRKMITPQETEYFFKYDEQNRLQTISVPVESQIDSIFYYKDSIVITTDLNNARDSKTSYTFNQNGQAIHQKFLPIGYEGWIEEIDYGYTDGKLTTVKRAVRSYKEPPEKATISTETIVWKNGNPIKINNNENGKSNGSLTMQYYDDKKFGIGDYQSYDQIMTGIAILKPLNLVKSVDGAETLQLSYEFDKFGNIISMTEKEENETRITKYQYECK